MPNDRVKVGVEHVQKTFYERLLYVWRQQSEDKNQKFVIYKAYVNLKSYPLEVQTVADLKHIHGIGETLAVRCHSAWEAVCASFPVLDLRIVKDLTDEDFIRFLDVAKNSVPQGIQPTSVGTLKSNKRQSGLYSRRNSGAKVQLNDPLTSVEIASTHRLGDVVSSHRYSQEASIEKPCLSTAQDTVSERPHYSICRPSEKAEVILLADSRENNVTPNSDTVVEFLTASNQRVEMRTLSVGDYLWILRKIDGTEVILDWIVERKTWSDLHQSIRSGRYEEQKQRLRHSPMKNRVYLVEGTINKEFIVTEQALATVLVSDGFMIQRSKKALDSAHFLCRLTEYLKTITASRQIVGMKFDRFQELSRKSRVETVKDMWIRQLMICPGMSSHRAQIVARRFPSFMSMMHLYTHGPSRADTLLSSAIPEVNLALSMQMCKFFSSVLPQ